MFILLSNLIIAGIIAVSVILLCMIVFFAVKEHNKVLDKSYDIVSDKDILLYINDQPDKVINKTTASRKFGLSKSQMATRLRSLQQNGVLSVLYNKTMTKYSYTISKPIDKPYDIELSQEPFMTLEDLLKIFQHYDYQVSMQELLLITGLPLKVIKREMKYFEDEKIINIMLKVNTQYSYHRIYMLNEPYRSNSDAFLNLENTNFELKEIYEKVTGDFV